jgi:hypothetical protein
MASLSPSALRVISQCHGVVTSQQLISFGLSDTQIGRLVETGQLLRERHSVFRHAAAPRTLDQRLALACAVSPSVAISHQSAGRKRGLRRLGRDQRIHATIPGRSHIRIPGVVIHRSHLILPTDVVEQDDGIRITSVERTIFDLANVVSIHAIESIIEQAIHDELCSISSLHVLGSRLCRQGRNGSERFRLEQAIVAAGLPRPIRQFEITLPDGSDIHPDLYWPDPPIVLEVDHSSWHGGREQQTYDKWRDRQLTRVGVRPMRVSEDDIRFRLESVIADLASVLRK